MKQVKSVKQAGPYRVTSHSQGRGIVSFEVFPAFPKYDSPDFKWAESRYKCNGGGPGIFTSIATARELEEFLNSVYPPEQVKDWEKRITSLLNDEAKDSMMAECDTCCTVSGCKKEHNFCPVCGNKIKKSKIPK